MIPAKKDSPLFDIASLPEIIKVRIIKGESGAFIAKLPEYDVFTEADTLGELIDFYINDLIYALFDVPKAWQGQIRYMPIEKPVKRELPRLHITNRGSIPFNRFSTTEFYEHYFA